ncbi:hypothetical protein TB2_003256 [Malus domestica]
MRRLRKRLLRIEWMRPIPLLLLIAGIGIPARTPAGGMTLRTTVPLGTAVLVAIATARGLRRSTSLVSNNEGSLQSGSSGGGVRVLKIKSFNLRGQLIKGKKGVTLMIVVVRVR